MPLNQVATVSVPEPRMLSVQVWDRSNVGRWKRRSARRPRPQPDHRRPDAPPADPRSDRGARKELAKLAGQYAEKAKIAVRNVRRDGMDALKQDEKKHEISEDERKRLETEVQKLTDETIKEIDAAPRPRKRKSSASDVRPASAARRGRPARRGGDRAAARRHHHGRQRPLGEGAGAAARRRPPPGRRSRPQGAPRAGEAGVECLTLYAFSSENWRRPETEINDLMGCCASTSARELNNAPQGGRPPQDHRRSHAPSRRCRAHGRRSGRAHRRQQRMTLAIALNYGSRGELVRAPQRSRSGRRGRDRAGREIDEARSRRSSTPRPAAARPPHPHVGRAAPVELPALAGGLCRAAVRRHALARFRRRHLRAALAEFAARERRYGGLMSGDAARRSPRRATSDLTDPLRRGVVMIAVALVAIYVGGWLFRLLVLRRGALMLIEWGDMHRVAPAAGAMRRGAARRDCCSRRPNISFRWARHGRVAIGAASFDPAWPASRALPVLAALLIGWLSGAAAARRHVAGASLHRVPAFALLVLEWAWFGSSSGRWSSPGRPTSSPISPAARSAGPSSRRGSARTRPGPA
jgi:ribosome recycling factor